MKNFLVPTNFTPEAHHAFEVAMQLAQRVGGRVVLLHKPDLPGGSGFVSSGSGNKGDGLDDMFAVRLLQNVKFKMHELMREALRQTNNVNFDEVISTEELTTAILDTIRSHDIDLVVMGTQPATQARPWWVGSNTEKVVQLAPCPVLTVKHAQPNFDVQHLVVASDFSDEADRLVPQLRELQELFPEASLHLLDVVAPGRSHEAPLQRIHAFASRHSLDDYEPDVIDAPRVREGIPRFAEQAHADLVVMLTHGHTGLSHLWHANTAENVATHTYAPVLTLRSA
ncbi:hypothetical protein PK28_07825 [Hymenobacter sp. DG25B]|uniref:universal stress protein n=1 Tax=Hymenobacter sp. DG25B TaxID=1385664 RepID=UPI00054126CE|nr:universal stress protein [Hymenobacter sp. DG25B]AIZ63622.1 hypothetical protein PK28_07825 [Hymenobacter sp. DG25B]